MEPDFGGYVTKYDVRCSDGATIKPGAFKHFHGKKVPLVYMHDHKTPENVLGHVALEERPDGLYGRAFLNDTPNAKLAREHVEHEDIRQFSIWANDLVGKGKDILHGALREVSLVLSGANKLALIDFINPRVQHSDSGDFEDGEAIVYLGDYLSHEDSDNEEEDDVAESTTSVKEVLDTLTDEQKDAVAQFVVDVVNGEGVESPDDSDDDDSDDSDDSTESDDKEDGDNSAQHSDLEGDNEMARNVFEDQTDSSKETPKALSHDAMTAIFATAKDQGSLRAGILAHADEYGIKDIESLFPEVRDVHLPPEFLKRDTGWVASVISKARKLPFSRVRTRFADIREDEARAKGYMKGNKKKEEVFTLLKRTTSPGTIYKKQKLDRDDIVDITDFDVVAWIRAEMRVMLEEELARAILLGDGRPNDHEDKIKDPQGAQDGVGIRSIANDDDFYAEDVLVAAPTTDNAQQFIDDIVRARRRWKGTGTPTLYTTVEYSSELLLARDSLQRRHYSTLQELASAMLVSEIVDVEVMEEYEDIVGILVNMADYSIGSTKGGEITNFDDFDIDYNQYKYLMETRLSGALTRYKAALVFKVGETEDPGTDGAGTMSTSSASTTDSKSTKGSKSD